MNTYTIVFATRLKRKVFRAGNIPKDVVKMVTETLKESGILLVGYKFYDYGVVICIGCTNRKEAERTADIIRKATSKPVRERYPELWKMPSLWNRNPLILEGEMNHTNMEKAEEYYRGLKTR